MAGLVEVLEVQCVVPDLVDRRAIERFRANLEFDDEYQRLANQNDVDPSADAWNVELEENLSFETEQSRLKYGQLLSPSEHLIGLGLLRVARDERSKNSIDVPLGEVVDVC